MEGPKAIDFDGALKLNYVVEFKRMLKHTCGSRAKAILAYIPEYPDHPAALALSHPDLHQNAYQGDAAVSLVLDFAELGRMTESVPLRASKLGSPCLARASQAASPDFTMVATEMFKQLGSMQQTQIQMLNVFQGLRNFTRPSSPFESAVIRTLHAVPDRLMCGCM